MAHQGHPVRGAEVGEYVNRGGRDLHSSHQNTENQNEIASLPQRDKTTGIPKKQLMRGRNSVPWCRSWKNWEHNEDGRKSATDALSRLPNSQQYLTLNKSSREPLLKPLARLPPQHRRGLAVAARGGTVGIVQAPRAIPLAIPSRVHREIVIKESTIHRL
ncbi:hypothetical protein E4U23_006341 [Claviceps purpurea]|nr:hypothetical protein E4U23_006341 [Claviceps purpurea]